MSAADIQYNYTNIILLINTTRCEVSYHDQSSYFITFPSILIKMSITKFLKIKITTILFSI